MFQTRSSILRAALMTATVSILPSPAANLYWDTNGATAASGNAASAWDTGTNWSTDPTGAAATTGWTNGSSAVFSAGTDGTATKAVTLAGTVATPSILLEEVGLVNITGGTIDITGSAVFNTSVLAANTNRSLTWTPVVTGTGALTLAVNGDTSATGGGSNTIFALTGASDFTGDVTITSGVVGYTSNLGNAANQVILNGGGLVFNTTGSFARNIQVGASGGVLRNYGSATSTLTGTLSGAGQLRRTDGGTAILTGSGTGFTGALNVQRGTMQIGDGTQTSNLIANAASLTAGDGTGGATLRYMLDASFTLPTAVTLNSNSTFTWQGKDAGDVMTVNGAIGSTAASNTIRVNSGTLAGAAGADLRALNLQLGATPASSATAELGVLAIGNGASVTTRFFDIGQGTGNAGKVEQSGGTATIEAGGTGFRLGHWTNGVTPGNVYNLTGGTLDASVTTVNIGWDGEGDMTVGGGAGTATLKAGAIQLDANGDSAALNDTLTVASNGVVEVTGAVAGASANDKLILSGGTMRGTGSGAWSAAYELAAATTSTIEVNSGITTTLSGAGSGSGDLNVTGAGTLSVTGTANLFSGNFTRTGGTLAGSGVISGVPTINGAISPGTAAQAVGVLSFGDATTTTTLNGNMIMDLSATGDPLASDLISVFENVSFGASATVSPVFTGVPSAATHILVSYFGTRTGAPTLDPTLQVRGMTFAIDTATAGEVQLVASGTAAPANLVWGGDGVGNNWNVNSASTWGGAQTFYQYDNVTFDDSGNNAANINITGNLTPGSVTVDGTQSYTFAGSGSIIGAPTLTKNSTGDLTILNDNKFGTINLNAGNLIVGNGGTTGSIGDTGAITVAAGTTLEFNRSNAFTYSRAATAGSTGTLVKKGSGTMTLGSASTLLPTNLTVDGGTLIATVASPGGFSSNRMEGAGQVTVNAGATLVIPAGSNHAFGGNNAGFTESFTINGGTMTVNQEQYFNNLTLSGATLNGTSDLRSSNASNWLVTGSTPTAVAVAVTNQNATNWNVEDVTASAAADLTVTSNITGGGATNKAGLGTLRASGTNSYTGATNINAGTYQAGSDRALGFGGAIGATSVQGTAVAAGAALDINGVTVNEVVTLNNGGMLTNTNPSTTGTLSNGLAGVRVVDLGTGYTGAPTIGITGGGGTGVTTTTAIAGGGLSTITTTVAGTGFTSAPTVTVTGGAGTGATASATISQLVLTGSGNQIGGAGNLSVPAVIVGSGSYSKTGAGTLTIPTGGSTFTGNIAVDAGTVTVTGQGNGTTSGLGAVSGTRMITLNGGTLNFGINNVFGNGATVVANLPSITVNPGATLAANNYNVAGPLFLNGGTVTDTRLTAPGGYQGFELKGTVTAGGTTPSLITAAGTFGHHLVGTIAFDVADVTGDAAADLTVATRLLNSSADNASAVANLTKTGSGTLVLNAANGYTGTTTVTGGTLAGTGSVAGALVVDATGTIAPGASAGDFGAGATTITGTYAGEIDGANEDTLVVTGNLDLTGATLNVSVLNAPTLSTYVIASFTGTRTGTFATVTGLPAGYSVAYNDGAGQVVITNAAGDAYGTWASANGISGAGGNVDSDGDGISNGIEFVLGGDPSGPNSNSNPLLPTVTVDATYMNFTFRRTDESLAYNPRVQYGTGLATWTDAVNGLPGGTPVVIVTENDFHAAGIDRVTVRVPKALAASGTTLFGRLIVDIP
jgi:fibronectin-binding autotransporter adhesin